VTDKFSRPSRLFTDTAYCSYRTLPHLPTDCRQITSFNPQP